MSTDGQDWEDEVYPDLPIYGFIIIGILFLSLVGSYFMTLFLVRAPNLKPARYQNVGISRGKY